jgi:hypothetical protein
MNVNMPSERRGASCLLSVVVKEIDWRPTLKSLDMSGANAKDIFVGPVFEES